MRPRMAIFFLFLIVPITLRADKYADVNAGSDLNACDQVTPCKTISRLMAISTKGEKLFVKAPGVYPLSHFTGPVINRTLASYGAGTAQLAVPMDTGAMQLIDLSSPFPVLDTKDMGGVALIALPDTAPVVQPPPDCPQPPSDKTVTLYIDNKAVASGTTGTLNYTVSRGRSHTIKVVIQ